MGENKSLLNATKISLLTGSAAFEIAGTQGKGTECSLNKIEGLLHFDSVRLPVHNRVVSELLLGGYHNI